MTYSHGDDCPSSYPVALPELVMRIRWDDQTPSPGSLSLSSGSVNSMHADFWNTWNQARLEQLVEACVDAGRHCDYEDVDALPFPDGPPTTGPSSTAPSTTAPKTTHPATTEPPTTDPTTTTPHPTTTFPAGDRAVLRSSFETGMAGWAAEPGTRVTLAGWSHSGSFAAVVLRSSSSAGYARITNTTDVRGADSCSARVWVAGPSGRTAVLRVRTYASGDREATASTSVGLPAGWTPITLNLREVGTATLRVDVYLRDAGPGQGMLVDDVEIRC